MLILFTYVCTMCSIYKICLNSILIIKSIDHHNRQDGKHEIIKKKGSQSTMKKLGWQAGNNAKKYICIAHSYTCIYTTQMQYDRKIFSTAKSAWVMGWTLIQIYFLKCLSLYLEYQIPDFKKFTRAFYHSL